MTDELANAEAALADLKAIRAKAVVDRRRQRKTIELWRRRYESGPNRFGTTSKPATAKVECPHAEVQRLVLTNKYWKKPVKPYMIDYTTRVVPITSPHQCVPGAA